MNAVREKCSAHVTASVDRATLVAGYLLMA